MPLLLLACLLTSFATLSQDPPHEPTILERIDALIAKANAYEHFVAVYHMHSSTGEDGQLHIRYRNPDWAYFESTLKDSPAAVAIIDDEIHLNMHPAGAGPVHGTMHGADRILAERDRLGKLLREVLPRQFHPGDLSSGIGLHFAMHLDEVPPEGRDGFNIDLNYNIGSVERFSWLEEIRRAPEQAVVSPADPTLIHFSPSPSVRISISTESGLVQRMERKTDGKFVALVTLESLDLSTRPARADFELPAAEPGSKDVSAEMDRGIERQLVQSTRGFFYEAVQNMNADGRLAWSDETRDKLLGVLEAEHEHLAKDTLRGALDQFGAAIEELARRVRESLDNGGAQTEAGRAELSEQVQSQRKTLEGKCETLSAEYAQIALESPKPRGEPAFRRELEEREKTILLRVLEERLPKPLLASFDEKVAKLLAEK